MPVGVLNYDAINLGNGYVPPSFADALINIMPNGTAPLFAMAEKLGSKTATQFNHGYWTNTMIFPSVTLGAAVADGVATTFTVTSTTNVIPNQVYQVASTNENVLVTAVDGTTSIRVIRGVGTVAAAAIANSVVLYHIGTAFEDGSQRPSALSILPVFVGNYTQTFRNTWATTGSTAQTQVLIGGKPDAKNRRDCMTLHATDIEKSTFFGQKSLSSLNGQPFHTMDGIQSILSNLSNYSSMSTAINVTTAGATTNWTQLETALDPVADISTDMSMGTSRVVFCGATAVKVINNIGRVNATYEVNTRETTYGLRFTQFQTSRATFDVVEHPIFNTNAVWKKMAFVLDLPSIKYAYLGDRKQQVSEFNGRGQNADNGVDAVGGSLLSELTLELTNPGGCAVITNLTAAAVG